MAKYKYKNRINGATFETDVLCQGGPWDLVGETTSAEPKEDVEPKKSKKASK